MCVHKDELKTLEARIADAQLWLKEATIDLEQAVTELGNAYVRLMLDDHKQCPLS